MGLAGPSKKRKISHDPNNTTWTRSEGFGHRMLSSQGWTPGTILGPDPNNPHHTSASQIGIKVVLKDDNLGLGCKPSQEDTCTGLGDLQSLLGRLNGKTQEVVKKEEDVRRALYASNKYGMVFVRGETLESTWVTGALKRSKGGGEVEEEEEEKEEDDTTAEDTSDKSEEEQESKERRKERKKGKKLKQSPPLEAKEKESTNDDGEDDDDSSLAEDSKSSKSARRAARKAEKALRKAEKLAKRERKESKRLRKDEKRRLKAEKKAMTSIIVSKVSTTPSSTASTPPIMPSVEIEIPAGKKVSKSLPNSLPTSGTSTPIPATGRQALRARWIAQKRMAVMDAKALNEILMIKA